MQITIKLEVREGQPRKNKGEGPSRAASLSEALKDFKAGRRMGFSYGRRHSEAGVCPQETLLEAALLKLTDLTQHFWRVREVYDRLKALEEEQSKLRSEFNEHRDDHDLFFDDDRTATSRACSANDFAIHVPGPEGEEC